MIHLSKFKDALGSMSYILIHRSKFKDALGWMSYIFLPTAWVAM